MTKNISQRVLAEVTEFYLNSRDFNGIPLNQMYITDNELESIEILIDLINDDKISITFEDFHPNPHIKAFNIDKEHQVEKLKSKQSHCMLLRLDELGNQIQRVYHS